MFSKNVFCGATSPLLPPGILGLESGGQDPRRGRGGLQEEKVEKEKVEKKPKEEGARRRRRGPLTVSPARPG